MDARAIFITSLAIELMTMSSHAWAHTPPSSNHDWSTVMPLTHQEKMAPTRMGNAAELHVYATESFVKSDACGSGPRHVSTRQAPG